MSGSENPKSLGGDAAIKGELADIRQRPEGNRSERVSGEGSAKGKRKRPLPLCPASQEANVPAMGKNEKESKARLKILSMFSPTLRKNPASEATVAPKAEKAQPASQEAVGKQDKAAPQVVEQVLAPLPNAQGVRARAQQPKQEDKLKPILEDEALDEDETENQHKQQKPPIEPVLPDVDSQYKNDMRFCSHYVVRIIENFKRRQMSFTVAKGFLEHQGHEVVRCREDVIDWLIETHHKLKLKKETLFLAVSYMDRYLEKKKIVKHHFQKLAATCLFHAGKYEEMIAPQIRDIVRHMRLSSTRPSTQINMRESIIAQESDLYKILEGRLAQPTIFVFIIRYLMVIGHAETTPMVEYCCYLAELGLYRPDLVATSPSKLATAIVLAARFEMNEADEFPDVLAKHSGHTFDEVAPLARDMVKMSRSLVTNVAADGGMKCIAVEKYDSPRKHHVSRRGLKSIAKKRANDEDATVLTHSRKFQKSSNGGKMRRE